MSEKFFTFWDGKTEIAPFQRENHQKISTFCLLEIVKNKRCGEAGYRRCQRRLLRRFLGWEAGVEA